jgi:cell division protein FtsB
MDQLKYFATRLHGIRRKLATWGLFVLAALLAVHVVFGANGWMVYEKKKADYRRMTSQVETLQQENKDLAAYNKALQTDRKTIEAEARLRLKYAKPGEVIYVVPAPLPKADVTSTAQNRDSKK